MTTERRDGNLLDFRARLLAREMLYSRPVRKPKRSKKKRLGIVPRALLGAAIAGSVPGAVVPACSSDSGTIDGPQFAVDANPPDAGVDRLHGVEFAVDANADAPNPDGPEFAVDAPTDA